MAQKELHQPEKKNRAFDELHSLQEVKHFLPSQAPLKDFIHHNTLHAFQHLKFHDALHLANEIFGYKTYLSIQEYQKLFATDKITDSNIRRAIEKHAPETNPELVINELLKQDVHKAASIRIGKLRENWKRIYHINMDKAVHPLLFRYISNYLDQGISIRPFPVENKGIISALREMTRTGFANFFKTQRPRELLLHTHCKIHNLLDILIGDERLYERYLFDQQFAHPGWSGMVSTLEDQPHSLLDEKKVTLHDFIALELLMEIDAMDHKFGAENWKPLGKAFHFNDTELFAPVAETSLSLIYKIWQDAYEWSYYDQVLNGILQAPHENTEQKTHAFDAYFCIDDRECSFRRYVEEADPNSRTFSTPGFFNVEFYFQPAGGKFLTKVCPAPLNPGYVIREEALSENTEKDVNFSKWSHSLLFGWLISQTLGFWSAFRLFLNIFKPSVGPATSYSFRHMNKNARLTIESSGKPQTYHGLQVGYTVAEMTDRVEGLFRSTGLIGDFSPLVYFIGHGASSVNNTHYAGYDCGACSGRPGSVNARVISYMANHPEVRKNLAVRGVIIPENTRFVGALHDTTRDEIEFYEEEKIPAELKVMHEKNKITFEKALHLNARERARRFVLMPHKTDESFAHRRVKLRSVSLFEPRPELNHATNALCIVGRRSLTDHLFLDRRAFLNSYDYRIDPDGKYLLNILKAAAPVCGGINLEYYFSRTDNYRLGAGTKLPHNVMGLIGVANGADGDLRPGLPLQMIEVHDPVRLLMIVEHVPETVLKTIQSSEPTYEWFINEWIHLVVSNPETGTLYLFKDGEMRPYTPDKNAIPVLNDLVKLVTTESDNLPVMIMEKSA